MRSRVRSATVGPQPIDAGALADVVADPDRGAVVTFAGVVRDNDHGRAVSALTYEGHPTAEAIIAEVAAEIAAEYDVLVAVAHRVGDLRIGDVALAAATSAVHRGPAFQACGELVDRVKLRLPVWKHQTFADGSQEWVNCA